MNTSISVLPHNSSSHGYSRSANSKRDRKVARENFQRECGIVSRLDARIVPTLDFLLTFTSCTDEDEAAVMKIAERTIKMLPRDRVLALYNEAEFEIGGLMLLALEATFYADGDASPAQQRRGQEAFRWLCERYREKGGAEFDDFKGACFDAAGRGLFWAETMLPIVEAGFESNALRDSVHQEVTAKTKLL